jgi:GT2 family glycosyltransferase
MTSTNTAAAGLAIVVLTCNRRELLRGCLESLFAQDDPGIPLQFIVVDDGSTDGTGDMVRGLTASRPQWKYVPQAHQGIAAARNAGIRNSQSALIAIVADDYLLPADYARSVAVFFKDHPQAQVVRFKVVAAGGGFLSRVLHAYQEASVIRRLAARNSGPNRRGLWRRQQAEEWITVDHDLEAAGAAAFRSGVFQRVGSFDESFIRGEDTDFTRRLRAAGIPVHYSPFQRIGHRYDSGLGAALKNAFISGRSSWRLSTAPGQKPASILYLAGLGLKAGCSALYWSCWRAWQSSPPWRAALYLPILLLIESSYKAGFFYEGTHSRKKMPAAVSGRMPR